MPVPITTRVRRSCLATPYSAYSLSAAHVRKCLANSSGPSSGTTANAGVSLIRYACISWEVNVRIIAAPTEAFRHTPCHETGESTGEGAHVRHMGIELCTPAQRQLLSWQKICSLDSPRTLPQTLA